MTSHLIQCEVKETDLFASHAPVLEMKESGSRIDVHEFHYLQSHEPLDRQKAKRWEEIEDEKSSEVVEDCIDLQRRSKIDAEPVEKHRKSLAACHCLS